MDYQLVSQDIVM